MNSNFLIQSVKVLRKAKPVYYTPKEIIKKIEMESIIANPPYVLK